MLVARREEVATEARRIRARLGLKQGELARLLGCGQGSLSRWESGGQLPSCAALAALRLLGRYADAGALDYLRRVMARTKMVTGSKGRA